MISVIVLVNMLSVDIFERCFAVFVLNSHVVVIPPATPRQSGAKTQIYCTIYYITLNSICEAQRVSKNLSQIVKDRDRGQN
jgi:hypothetical protein